MDIFDRANLKALLADHPSPCVSIFMPTHRLVDQQDPIRFKVRLGEAEAQLTAAGLRGPEVKDLLKPARVLLEDSAFWHNQSEGLAFFLAQSFVHVYRLPIAFPDLVVVGDAFHVKPLLPLLGDAYRYYVLALSQNGVRLLQGTPRTVSEVDLKGVPRSLAEAMLNHDVDETLNFHTQPALGLGRGSAMFHGHGVGIDDAKDDLLRFFQQIDRGLHPVLREQRAPLVLAAVEYLMPIYHKANTYPHLLDKGINGNPDHLDNQRLHDLAWAIVQPVFQKARQNASAHYEQLAGTGRTANDLGEVVHAAHAGQIESLFIPADRDRWGTFDPTTDLTTVHAKREPGDQDLLNLAAVHTLLHGGAVYLVPADDMPGHGMMAATYWQPHTRKVLV